MADEIERLKKENEELKKEVELYKKDSTIRGFYVLNKIVNQQINMLEDFDFDTEIKKNPKDDKYFDRAKAVWEGLKGMVSDLNALKIELKITGSKDKDEKNIPFIETVATQRN